MAKRFPIYKGLQKPLIYKGFQGKFIGWGIGSLVTGVVLGGLIGSLTHMYLGGIITITIIGAGLLFTSQEQKKGLHNKNRYEGVFLIEPNFKIRYHAKKEKERI